MICLEDLDELIGKTIRIACCSCWEEFLLWSHLISLTLPLLLSSTCHLDAVFISIFYVTEGGDHLSVCLHCGFPVLWVAS